MTVDRFDRTRVSRARSPTAHRGYITVMMAALLGLAFTATVLGTGAYIRSTQATSTASHAQVQAQLKAWTGTELVRQYLAAVQASGTTNLAALAAVVAAQTTLTPLSFSGVSGITGQFVSVDSATAPTTFTVDITGTTATGTSAQATSTIQAVYSVTTAGGGSSTIPALNFNRNLVLGGSITIDRATPTTQYAINVLGDVSTSGNTITHVDYINSTGTININSGSTYQVLNANCDVVITGSVTASIGVSALRNVCETGGASVTGTALANGSVLAQSAESKNGTINARASPTNPTSCQASGYNGSGTTNASTCPASTISGGGVDLSAGGAGAAIVNTDGSVVLGNGSLIGNLEAQGSLTCGQGATVTTGKYASGTGCANASKVSPNTVTITPATAVTLTPAQFNAYNLQTAANYQLSISSAGLLKVTVTHVNGIVDGTTYYVGSYGNGYYDYLCTTPSTIPSSPGSTPTVTCGTSNPPAGALKFCWNGTTANSYTSCFGGSWNSSTHTLTITANQNSPTSSPIPVALPPGLVWFGGVTASNGTTFTTSGNLALTGTFYNSFIATGNITGGSTMFVYAPNFAGYSGTNAGVSYAPTGICANSAYPTTYPTQFCNISATTFDATASSGIGNYAFMAGSLPYGTTTYSQSSYQGGNITTGSSNKVYGDIQAGNEFKSGGSTTVAGTITALGQGSAAENNMGGSTELNFTSIPPTESLTGGASGTGEGVSSGTTAVAIEWARYL